MGQLQQMLTLQAGVLTHAVVMTHAVMETDAVMMTDGTMMTDAGCCCILRQGEGELKGPKLSERRVDCYVLSVCLCGA